MGENKLIPFFQKTDKITEIRVNQREALDKLWEALDKGDTKIILEAPTGAGKCLNIMSNIHTNRGLMLPTDLNTNDKVIGFNTESKTIENAIVSSRTPNELKDVMKITTRQGYEIICTQEHKILIFNGDFIWKEAKDIKYTDVIPINRTNNLINHSDVILNKSKFTLLDTISPENTTVIYNLPNNTNIDFAYFLGIVVGNGNFSSSYIKITFNNKDTDLLSFILKYTTKLKIPTRLYKPKQKNCCDISIKSILLLKWLGVNGFKKEKSILKEVPSFILKSSSEIQCAFLKGLFDTDGHVGKGNIEYSTSSQILGEQVHQLLLINGIISHRIQRTTKCKGKSFISWRISISGDDARLYNKYIGFGAERKQHALNILINRPSNPNLDTIPFIKPYLQELHNKMHYYPKYNLKWFAQECINNGTKIKTIECFRHNYMHENPSYSSLSKILKIYEPLSYSEPYNTMKLLYNLHFYYDTIRSIEHLDEKILVCDLEVPLTHSFVANGFIVHNSAIANTAFNYFNSLDKVCLYTSPLNELVNQIANSEFGFDTLKGRRNYPCLAKKPDCGVGYCRVGKCPNTQVPRIRACKDKPYGDCGRCVCWKCIYKAVFQKYKESKKGNTNFTLFMMGVTNNYDVLVCDEADSVEPTVRDHFSITIPILINKSDFIDHLEPLQQYMEYLSEEINKLDPKEISDEQFRKREDYLKLYGKINFMLEDVTNHGEPWVITTKPLNQKTMYQPITIDRFLEPLLANKTIIMMSATPPNYAGYAKIEVDSVFPIETRQWSYVPLGKMSMKFRDKTIPKLAVWLSKLKGKTLVHAHSYLTAQKIAEPLRMLGINPLLQVQGNGESTGHNVSRYDAVKAFVDSKESQKILLSVSLARGVDFHQLDILNNIITTVPWPNPTDPLTKAKNRLLGESWQSEQIAQDIAQAYGRIHRSEKMGVLNGIPTPKRTYIVDSNFGSWYANHKKLFPKWFRESQLKVVK